jgi:hypothetical protein
LKVWEDAPMDADIEMSLDAALALEGDDRRRDAAMLLKRMLDAGVSRYHPDPLAALEKATG